MFHYHSQESNRLRQSAVCPARRTVVRALEGFPAHCKAHEAFPSSSGTADVPVGAMVTPNGKISALAYSGWEYSNLLNMLLAWSSNTFEFCHGLEFQPIWVSPWLGVPAHLSFVVTGEENCNRKYMFTTDTEGATWLWHRLEFQFCQFNTYRS